MAHNEILFQIQHLSKYFPVKQANLFRRGQQFLKAVDDVSLAIYRGETLGLVGESGCGKSTLGRVLLRLYPQTGGSVLYYGRSRRAFCPRYVRRSISELRKHARSEAELQSLAPLFGGLLLETDREEVIRALLAEYDAGARLRALEWQRGRPAHAEPDAEHSRAADALAACTARLDAIRARHAGEPLFAELEALRNDGIDLAKLTSHEMRLLRKDMQVIFQDPYASLNPRMSAGRIIGEGPVAHGFFSRESRELQRFVAQVMEECGLPSYMVHRYPHQFSGGQRQRIGIARALALRPQFVVCDEAVSALDMSIQAQVLNLLQDLKKQLGLTYLFISHDLSVVKYISDRVAVMYLGGIVELASTQQLFSAPLHPYTQALLSAIPSTDCGAAEAELPLSGDVPSPLHPPGGCKFHTRCPHASPLCASTPPRLEEAEPGHYVACHIRRFPVEEGR